MTHKENVPGNYGEDRNFLKKYTDAIELKNGNASVLVVPQYQGRVMTSSCQGDSGLSFGWINYNLIASGENLPHINPYGGEERLWLGPEGGQFSIFFKKDVSYDFENWFTPKELDTVVYKVISQKETEVDFQHSFQLTNRFGTALSIGLKRKIKLLDSNELENRLNTKLNSVELVAYETQNVLSNEGKEAWKKETGLLSIWMLGMLKPSPKATIVMPVKDGSDAALGPKFNDDYFGSISQDRLKVKDSTIYFKADGNSRGKIGIPPLRATRFIGSYDSISNVLTLLECILPKGETEYVNSKWEDQKDPFSGDALNAYNDGPLDGGGQLGPFYELETSSPASKLAPGKSLEHRQTTYHITGNKEKLNEIALKTLGVDVNTISNIFG